MVSTALRDFVLGLGSMGLCNHCGKEGTVVNEVNLNEHIEALFESILVPFDALPKMTQVEIECGADHPIREIFDHLEFYPPSRSEDFNSQLCDRLEQNFVDQSCQCLINQCFMINDGQFTENIFHSKWRDFLRSIQFEHRFFNHIAKEFLDDLFHILTYDFDLKGKGVIKTIDAGVPLYRARIAASIELIATIKSQPASELGPTPSRLASDQRMSPAGISVFYGALDRGTCISEIRPLVGDFAVSAEFRAMSELNLIDLNKLTECIVVEDIYHDEFVRHSHAVSFFKEMLFQMSRPARRESGNPYLPTQVIFEYLRVKFSDFTDGIIYSSVQQDQAGSCVALFPESSDVSLEPKCTLVDNEGSRWQNQPSYTLFYAPDSLRYHRVRGVSYLQEEYDEDLMLILSDGLLPFAGKRI